MNIQSLNLLLTKLKKLLTNVEASSYFADASTYERIAKKYIVQGEGEGVCHKEIFFKNVENFLGRMVRLIISIM